MGWTGLPREEMGLPEFDSFDYSSEVFAIEVYSKRNPQETLGDLNTMHFAATMHRFYLTKVGLRGQLCNHTDW